MSTDQSAIDIEYPESDGKPMGETDLHRNWIVRIIDLLQQRYRGQQVYVTGDLLLYYEEGSTSKFLVPDIFVVFDRDPGPRRTYKLWEEDNKSPNVVIEVTSRSTKGEDLNHKPQKFSDLGIAEYFLFDPTRDYLNPPLRGYRMIDGEYVQLEFDTKGGLVSDQLNVRLCLDAKQLVMHDLDTDKRLLTEAEAEHEARELEQAAREREQAARQAAEAEVQRLRKLLDKRDND